MHEARVADTRQTRERVPMPLLGHITIAACMDLVRIRPTIAVQYNKKANSVVTRGSHLQFLSYFTQNIHQLNMKIVLRQLK